MDGARAAMKRVWIPVEKTRCGARATTYTESRSFQLFPDYVTLTKQ